MYGEEASLYSCYINTKISTPMALLLHYWAIKPEIENLKCLIEKVAHRKIIQDYADQELVKVNNNPTKRLQIWRPL